MAKKENNNENLKDDNKLKKLLSESMELAVKAEENLKSISKFMSTPYIAGKYLGKADDLLIVLNSNIDEIEKNLPSSVGFFDLKGKVELKKQKDSLDAIKNMRNRLRSASDILLEGNQFKTDAGEQDLSKKIRDKCLEIQDKVTAQYESMTNRFDEIMKNDVSSEEFEAAKRELEHSHRNMMAYLATTKMSYESALSIQWSNGKSFMGGYDIQRAVGSLINVCDSYSSIYSADRIRGIESSVEMRRRFDAVVASNPSYFGNPFENTNGKPNLETGIPNPFEDTNEKPNLEIGISNPFEDESKPKIESVGKNEIDALREKDADKHKYDDLKAEVNGGNVPPKDPNKYKDLEEELGVDQPK